jgi:hypothetical protein
MNYFDCIVTAKTEAGNRIELCPPTSIIKAREIIKKEIMIRSLSVRGRKYFSFFRIKKVKR